jgi:hypothetical protein
MSRIPRRFLTINNGRTYGRDIVVITLTTIITTCAIVFYPSISETSSFALGQAKFKFFDGRLKFGEFGTEERVDHHFFLRPIYGDWIKSFEFSKNLTSKDSSGSTKGFIPEQGKPKQYNNKRTTNAEHPNISRGQIESEDYHILWSLLPVYVALLFVFIDPAQRKNQPERSDRLY